MAMVPGSAGGLSMWIRHRQDTSFNGYTDPELQNRIKKKWLMLFQAG
jgi:hypothetical protein